MEETTLGLERLKLWDVITFRRMTGKIIQGENVLLLVVKTRTSIIPCKDGGVFSWGDSCCVLLREPPRCDALGYWPAFESFPLPFALQPRCLELQKPTWLRQTKLKISDGRILTKFMAMEPDQKGVCVCVCARASVFRTWSILSQAQLLKSTETIRLVRPTSDVLCSFYFV